MNQQIIKKEMKKIAKEEGIKESEVRNEMEKAILTGFLNPVTRNQWNEIFGAGKLPSLEEFIMIMCEITAK